MLASALLACWRDAALCLAVLIASAYFWFQVRFSHWSAKGIAGPAPSFPAGNIGSVFLKRKQFFQPFIECYEQYKRLPYAGMYTLYNPVLVVNDVGLIKRILVKDFSHFAMHGTTACAEMDPLSTHLFNLHGEKWKRLRNLITPTFSSGKMKLLFGNLLTASKEMEAYLDRAAASGTVEDLSAVFANYSLDVIGRVAFGLECNCFGDPDSTYKKNVHEFLEPSSFYWQVVRTLWFLTPELFRRLRLTRLKPEVTRFFVSLVRDTAQHRRALGLRHNDFLQVLLDIQDDCLQSDGLLVVRTLWFLTPELFRRLRLTRLKPEVTRFFMSLVRDTAQHRRALGLRRNDFLQMLLDIQDECLKSDEPGGSESMSWAEMAGNGMMYLAAGYETSSTTATFAVYELAQQPAALRRCREELARVLARHGGRITHDALAEMTYLTLVVEETLRKHPPMRALFRRCTKDYQIPGSKTCLERGTWVFVPVQALQNDPDIFPEPHVFDPARFLPENKTERQNSVYMPFGDGPKMCLGIRFGMMSTKLALASFLSRYSFSLDPRTPIPVRYKTSSLPLAIDPGLYVTVAPLMR